MVTYNKGYDTYPIPQKLQPTMIPNVDHFAVPVVHPTTGETISIFKQPHVKPGQWHWSKDIKTTTACTDSIFVITCAQFKQIPIDHVVTYVHIVMDYRLQNSDLNRICLMAFLIWFTTQMNSPPEWQTSWLPRLFGTVCSAHPMESMNVQISRIFTQKGCLIDMNIWLIPLNYSWNTLLSNSVYKSFKNMVLCIFKFTKPFMTFLKKEFKQTNSSNNIWPQIDTME